MKEEIKEIAGAVDALLKMASQYERGQLIAWAEIELLSGPRNDNRGRHIIHKWRKRLEREREIVTLCADTIGVRLLTHKETASEIPALRQRKAYRQIRRAIKQVSTVDDSRLSDHERRLLASQRANMAATRRELHRSRKELTRNTATETNPRRVVKQ